MMQMIYFKGGEKAKSVRELLEIGFSHNGGYLSDGIKLFCQTYKDEECTIHQTIHNARRSFYELLEIARTYFPNTTEEILAYNLIHKMSFLYARYCHNINRVVFYRYINYPYRWCIDPDAGNENTVDPTGISFNYVKKMADDVQNRLRGSDRPGWNSF